MSSKERTSAAALACGGAVCVLALVVYCQSGAESPPAQASPAGQREQPTAVAAEAPTLLSAARVPGAILHAPTKLTLDAYELTPATFVSWRDYLAGNPKERLWEQIPWRTTLWDGVVDAHTAGKPILLEIHGGNALGRC